MIGNTGANVPAFPESFISDLYAAAHRVVLEPPPEIEEVAFAYTEFGSPSEIYSRDYIEDLDITMVEFANRVRLNIKKIDFSTESISMNVRIGTGQLSEPIDQPGLSFHAGYPFILGGLGQHSSDGLRRILAGRNVGGRFGIGEDAFVLSGAITPDDLLLQLQLATAYLVDSGFRPEADRQIRKSISQYYLRLAHIPQGPLQTEVPRLLASGDTRFGLPPEEVLSQRSLSEARVWLAPELERGAIEIGLVGDLDVDNAIAAVAQTFGALPSRGSKPLMHDRRQVSFPEEPFTRNYTVSTEIPKGVVSLYWPTTEEKDVHVARRLNVLSKIFQDRLRLKVREELGGSYSPNAGSSTSDTYDSYGSINAYIVVDPPKASSLARVTHELANDLAQNGTNEDALERAVLPILTSLRENARTNGYWLGAVLSRAQEFPQRLEWARSRYTDMEAITVAEITALAAKYLGDDRAFEFIVLTE
ncbi:MAG: insulinase family protein [Candidatus Synoicihabitans palmerolidicus]|nr:insulinase family protein [Candidatus Synoicihabitans palmerolidicus]